MIAKELAEKLLQYPEYNVQFGFMEPDESNYGISLRTFENIEITDIGHSDKVIMLSGKEN